MKKIAVYTIIFGLLAVVTVVLYKFNNLKLETKVITKTSTDIKSNIPLFEFTTLNGAVFSKYDLDKNRSTIIVYFDPDCGLCEKSAELFYTFQKLHKASQILFVSSADIIKIQEYIKKFNLAEISNITFYTTDFDAFYTAFKETATPTYIMYNASQKHIKTINEDLPAKIILRYIKAAQLDEEI